MIESKSFILKFQGLANILTTPCTICEAYMPSSNIAQPLSVGYYGLWDTGATGSVISANVVSQLNLQPTGTVTAYHANGSSIVNTYLINIYLPNGVGYHSIKVTQGILSGFDVLIGMDIISKGDFSITNCDGKTCFSFRTPSIKEVDYVKDKQRVQKVDPYSLCTCSSGKKYKFCHGQT